nr:hypothetical protein [uncultured Flavobacterium sp.]
MAKIILNFGCLLFVVNTLFGLIISSYSPLNWVVVDAILSINILLLYKISTSKMNNGFKVSLSFIFPSLGMISTVLAVLSPDKLKDNYYLIGFIFILFIEITFYLIAINLKLINQKK